MSRTFKDKLPFREKEYHRSDRYDGGQSTAYDESQKKKLKKELSRANRRLLKQEGLSE